MAVAFNNSGSTAVQSGTLSLTGGGDGSGSFTVAAGATLGFDSGTMTLASGSSISGAGTAEFGGGTINDAGSYDMTSGTVVDGGTVNFTGTVSSVGNLTVSSGTVNFSTGAAIALPTLVESGGTLTGSDTVNVAGALTWTNGTMSGNGMTNANGGLTLGAADNAVHDEILSVRALNNFGAAIWLSSPGSSYFDQQNASVFNNEAGASFTIENDLPWYNDENNSTFNNAGTVTVAAGTTGFHTLAPFSNNEQPRAGVITDSNGNLYGTTYGGGNFGSGTVFEISPGGTLTNLVNFNVHNAPPGNGSAPLGGLVMDASGNLYGTTSAGGMPQGYYGTIFKISPDGSLTYLFENFNPSVTGATPNSSLLLDANGNLYGTTEQGGAFGNFGTVFELSPNGTLTTLHSFNGSDGAVSVGGLVMDSSGNLYGVTESQVGGHGTVFKLSPNGTLTNLHSFANSPDGGTPAGGLIMDSSGNLFGTTSAGGADGGGTVFEISSSGGYSILHSFSGNAGEGGPAGGLVMDSNGNLYGTTAGGSSLYGTVFELSPGGTFTTLHTFNGGDGAAPLGNLTLDGNGNLFGTTSTGSNGVYGTVWEVAGAAPAPIMNVAFNNSGTVQVQTGTLSLSNGGSIINGSFTVDSGATLGLDGGTFTFDSTSGISGAGRVRIASGSTLTDEDTTLTGVDVIDNGTIDLVGSSPTISRLDGSGIVTSSVAGLATLTITGSGNFSGTIQNGSGTVGLSKAGTGTEILTSTNNTYTGPTSVSTGTLEVDGTITSSVTVSGAGALTGAGTVLDVTAANGAVFAPGDLSTAGVTLQSGSSLDATIAGNTAGAGTGHYSQDTIASGSVTIGTGSRGTNLSAPAIPRKPMTYT